MMQAMLSVVANPAGMVATMALPPGIAGGAVIPGAGTLPWPRPGRPNPFERLVQIVQENDRLFAELRGLGARLQRARAYRAEPGCNPALAVACYERAKRNYRGVLLRLRANRIEAVGLLGPSGRRQGARGVA